MKTNSVQTVASVLKKTLSAFPLLFLSNVCENLTEILVEKETVLRGQGEYEPPIYVLMMTKLVN